MQITIVFMGFINQFITGGPRIVQYYIYTILYMYTINWWLGMIRPQLLLAPPCRP